MCAGVLVITIKKFLSLSLLVAILIFVGLFLILLSFYFTSLEVCLVSHYCVQESVIINLAVNNAMFHVRCVKIIQSSAALLEHDNGAVVEVHIYV